MSEAEGRPFASRFGPLRAARGVRARILVYAVALLLLGIAVTVVTVRQILLVRLDAQVDERLTQEVAEFDALAAGVDPQTGRPFGPRIRPLFDLFLARNVPAADEQLLTYVDGRFYRREPSGGPMSPLSSSPALGERLAGAERPLSGTVDTPEGPVRYLAVPVSSQQAPARGTFVAAYSIGEDRAEVDDAVTVVGIVGAVVALIGSLVAYLAAGRVLAPLRELTETATAIEETDLTRRIDVRGEDELAELGRTFNAMLDRLEAAFGSQRELIRDVSHELRTPITIARGHLEVMGDDPVERAETLELVTDELDRMGRLVDDLVTLARAERPDFLRTEAIDIAGFTGAVLAKSSSLGERRWTLDVKTDGRIEADPQRLTQALVNLADNAVKQTNPGARIEIGAALDGGEARFWVGDEGHGLSAAEQRTLFDRFARGRGGARYEGTGLGLAIVRAIADAHGGRVEVSSRPGRGARFTIVIPARRVPAEPPVEVPA